MGTLAEMSCCPAESWPGLTTDYVPKGSVTEMERINHHSSTIYPERVQSAQTYNQPPLSILVLAAG